MILTKKQFEDRVGSERNASTLVQEHRDKDTNSTVEIVYKDGIHNKNGRTGTTNLTENEKIAIGVLASTVGIETAADLFNVSKSTASDLKNGMQTLSTNPETGYQQRGRDVELSNKIKERLENSKLTIQERAAEKLMESMGLIDNDKLQNASAKDLAQISNQMSQVMRNMNRKDEKDPGKAEVKIIVHQPKTAREDSFEIIEIGVR